MRALRAASGALRRVGGRSCASLSSATSALKPKIEAVLRHDYAKLDPHAPEMLAKLQSSDAPLIWHKHGSFLDHLRDVWCILCAWDQPQATCRLGLYHSAYSNSYVAMKVYDIATERGAMREMIGEEAENLVYKFCVINRQQLEDTVLAEGTIRRGGYDMKHIRTGDPVHLTGPEAAACVTQTLADMMDQSFGWQSDLEAGRCSMLWPGPYEPTLRMGRISRSAVALRKSGLVDEASLPPIFARCSRALTDAGEYEARRLYVRVANKPGPPTAADAKSLVECAILNPFVAEPHVVRAQVLLQMGQFDEADRAARQGLGLLQVWCTQWDKRMPFVAWVDWARCLIYQANQREWPSTHGGLESLGAVDANMQTRKLNTDRLG